MVREAVMAEPDEEQQAMESVMGFSGFGEKRLARGA